ncbi:expressed unknown protein [Ectocarpus siliculosus]|uniref:Uncharacterized protein n=1 Tax=Ectocarpus siliculosus TaxID=2880 RepID=D8LEY4_ECTSI|nr:expressed unknown protein [Ectocarpus siliculosus]|eukprot:CBN79804.1 expressed unknown protein [Ectocarpus siliculosus]
MAQFLIKIVNHFASEIITKRLANSRAFQQFAMKTHLKVEQTKKKVADNPGEAAKLMRGAGEKVKAEVDSVASSFERFKAALKKEVAQGGGGASSSSGASSSAGSVPRNGSRSDDIAARVQRRRRR